MQEEVLHQRVKLAMKEGRGYSIPLGPVNLVAVVTENGLICNDVVDIEALENYDYPAAKIGPAEGSVIETLEDLMEGEVTAANLHAVQHRIEVGMSAREAANRL
jgi:uncharacterized protein YunC (DUF1805 family)